MVWGSTERVTIRAGAIPETGLFCRVEGLGLWDVRFSGFVFGGFL